MKEEERVTDVGELVNTEGLGVLAADVCYLLRAEPAPQGSPAHWDKNR